MRNHKRNYAYQEGTVANFNSAQPPFTSAFKYCLDKKNHIIVQEILLLVLCKMITNSLTL